MRSKTPILDEYQAATSPIVKIPLDDAADILKFRKHQKILNLKEKKKKNTLTTTEEGNERIKNKK